MANVEPGFSAAIIRVRFTCCHTAHLTGKAISVQNDGSGFFGDTALKCREGFEIYQHILAGFEIAAIVVCNDVHPFFATQLADPAAPFAGTCHFA